MELTDWLEGNVQRMKHPLYKNSIYLIINSLLIAFFGFFFWVVAGRLYSPEYIGYGTALISIAGLIGVIALLGFGTTLLKFIPETQDKKGLFGSCMLISMIVASLASIIFLVFIDYFSPQLLFIRQNLAYTFICFSIFIPVFTLIDSYLIAQRKTKLLLIKNSIWCIIKIALLFLFTSMGMFAIFGAYGLAIVIIVVASLIIISPEVGIYKGIGNLFGLSMGNYIGGIFNSLPKYILPILILNKISPEATAYFYIPLSIVGLLFIIPNAVSSNLLVESSYTKENRIRGAVKFSLILLLIGIIGVFLLGGFLLEFIGGGIGMGYGVSLTTFLLSIGIGTAVASAAVHISEIFTTLVSGVSHFKIGNFDKKNLYIPCYFRGYRRSYRSIYCCKISKCFFN